MSVETLITIASLIVTGTISALALLLNYQERRSNYRNTLYSKQIEAYTEIIQAANQVVVNVYDMADYALRWEPSPGDSFPEYEGKVAISKEQFREIRRKWILFLPTKVQNALNAFDKSVRIMSYWDLTDYDGADEPFEVDQKYVDRVNSAYATFVEVAREALGTEPLSAQSIKLIGKLQKRKDSSVKF